MNAAAFCEGEALAGTRLRSEKGADLVEEATEARSGAERFEPARGTVPLLNAAMVLLHMVVQIAIRSMRYLGPEDVSNGPWVGVMAIGGDAVGGHPGDRPRRPKKRLGRREVAGAAEPCVDQLAVPVDGPVQIAPAPLDPEVGLIRIPAVSDPAMTPLAQRLTQERSEFCLPVAHSFMCEHEPSLEKHFRQIPQTQFVPEAPQDDQANHIGGILQPIIERSRPFVKPPLTVTTAKAAVPQLRPIRAFSGRGRPTMRACHGLVLLSETRVYMLCQRK